MLSLTVGLTACALGPSKTEQKAQQTEETTKALARLAGQYVITDASATPIKLEGFDLLRIAGTQDRAELTVVSEGGDALLDKSRVTCIWDFEQKSLACTNDEKTYSIYLTEARNLNLPAPLALNSYFFKLINWGDTHHWDVYLAKHRQ
jgi:hypothetical protein